MPSLIPSSFTARLSNSFAHGVRGAAPIRHQALLGQTNATPNSTSAPASPIAKRESTTSAWGPASSRHVGEVPSRLAVAAAAYATVVGVGGGGGGGFGGDDSGGGGWDGGVGDGIGLGSVGGGGGTGVGGVGAADGGNGGATQIGSTSSTPPFLNCWHMEADRPVG